MIKGEKNKPESEQPVDEEAQDLSSTTGAGEENVDPDSRRSAEAELDPESMPERAELTPAMREFVKDEVVLSLYQQNLITWPQVFDLVRTCEAGDPLWRELAKEDTMDSAMVWFEAARLNGVPMAELTESDPGDDIIRSILDLFKNEVVAELLESELLPVELETVDEEDKHRIIYATRDPLGQDTRKVENLTGKPAAFQYAGSQTIQLRIKRLNILPDESAAVTSDEVESMVAGAMDDDFFNTYIAPNLDEFGSMFSDDSGAGPSFGLQGGADPSVSPDVSPGSADSVSYRDGAGDTTDWSGGDGGKTGYGDDDFSPVRLAEGEDLAGNEGEPDLPEDRKGEATTEDYRRMNIRDRVAMMLLHKEIVSKADIERAQEARKKGDSKEALWRYLASSADDTAKEAIYAEAASVYAFKDAELGEGRPEPDFAKLVMEAFTDEKRDKLFALRVIPVEYESDSATGGAKLVFATHDPARPDLHRFLQQLKLGRFELQFAPESSILRLYGEIFPKKNEFLEKITDDPLAVDLGTSYDSKENELIDEDALEAEISRSSLINLFEATLVEATRSGVSDIHIFPNAKRKIDIYFRVDGRLHKWHTEDRVHPESFLAVVKDNAMNVDRFERDMAQDGFIQRHIDDALIRFRVSVLPIATASQEVRAESIVIRVLDDRKVLTDLRKLGMLDVALERFDKAIRQPHGMVILTGPTGSGKSTTLVAALHQVVTPEVNVLTVEDPVEYIINGVRQIKLSHKLSLEGALRSILRHDPDVVMVGEMRDRPTAELAIKLANTGHLTFSTLHTNDAPSAVSRLYKMGVEPFLLAYAINLVVAQRLIRDLCPSCKMKDEDPDEVLLRSLGFSDEEIEETTFYTRGEKDDCKTCSGSGYKGRRAMCETLYFSREIRHMIVEAGDAIDEDAIREQATSEGMLTLLDSAREIVKMGDTSIEELIRVTSTE